MGNTTETLKHKPSRKVALEEVLASLQDLVNNEFADDAANQAESEQTPNVLSNAHADGTPRRRGRPRKYPLPQAAETAVQPVKAEAITPSETVDYTYSQEQADLFGEVPAPTATARKRTKTLPPQSPQAGRAPVPQKPARPARKPTHSAPMLLDRGELETPAKRANLRVVERVKPAPEPKPKATEHESASIMSSKANNTAENRSQAKGLDWADDIPVLTEVVDPRELDFGELKDVVDQSLARKDLAPEAREIAVKVAAKLNIEMRKEGGSQLDVKTIMRLQALLKEALEPKG